MTRGSSSSATTAARGSSGIQITRGGDVGSRIGYRPRARPSRSTRHERTGRRLSSAIPYAGSPSAGSGGVGRQPASPGVPADERHEPAAARAHRGRGDGDLVDAAGSRLVPVDLLQRQHVGVESPDGVGEHRGVGARRR